MSSAERREHASDRVFSSNLSFREHAIAAVQCALIDLASFVS